MSERWRVLGTLAVAELLAMTLWFSASAVVPQLASELGLAEGRLAWLTMSVQLGFVLGAVGSALTNLADRVRASRLFAASALAGAALNGAIAIFEPGFGAIVLLRLATGVCLAGVYPTGMKLMASWFTEGRGLAIGVLVGALTIGSAVPHLLNALPVFGGEAGLPPWRSVLLAASALAAAGAAIGALFVREGPALPGAAGFEWRYALRLWTERPLRLANFGYLGHMWELYAMWTWTPILLLASFRAAGRSEVAARLVGFAVVAVGGAGCVVAGRLADRWGRTLVSGVSLAVSGGCCLVAGFLFDHPAALAALCLVWGFAVVADSAQFSAAISELCDPRYVGTALMMQTASGFLLTLFTIRMVPPLAERLGWGPGLMVLAAGPVFGLVSMVALRRLPEAASMASGNR